jgi:hypothetical protein
LKIISFWGGPGVGKSTAALDLAATLKKLGKRTEYCPEYAKQLTFDKRFEALADQVYILAKQNRIYCRHEGHGVEYLVTDTALPFGLIYSQPEYFSSFKPLVMEMWNSYDAINIFIRRNNDYEYDPIGRNQTEGEARKLDYRIWELLEDLELPFEKVPAGDTVVDKVLELLGVLN